MMPEEYLGKRVLVTNPDIPDAEWSGLAVAASTEPVILVEQDNGHRLLLPARWVTVVEP